MNQKSTKNYYNQHYILPFSTVILRFMSPRLRLFRFTSSKFFVPSKLHRYSIYVANCDVNRWIL